MGVAIIKELELFDTTPLDINKDYDLECINDEDQELIKSKERVQQHGEVFTPNWMVKQMLSEPTIHEKVMDLNATFLEPSAGEGAFLIEILHQRLSYIDQKANKSNWTTMAMWALMSIYGIELLVDNLLKARSRMLEVVVKHYRFFFQADLSNKTDFYKSAKFVITANIVQGNTLEYVTSDGNLIEFSHWWPVDGKVKRKIFTYKSLFNSNYADDIGIAEGQLSLFDDLDKDAERKFALCDVTKVYKEELEK